MKTFLDERVTALTLKTSEAYRAWLQELSQASGVPLASIARGAFADWARAHGCPPPPREDRFGKRQGFAQEAEDRVVRGTCAGISEPHDPEPRPEPVGRAPRHEPPRPPEVDPEPPAVPEAPVPPRAATNGRGTTEASQPPWVAPERAEEEVAEDEVAEDEVARRSAAPPPGAPVADPRPDPAEDAGRPRPRTLAEIRAAKQEREQAIRETHDQHPTWKQADIVRELGFDQGEVSRVFKKFGLEVAKAAAAATFRAE